MQAVEQRKRQERGLGLGQGQGQGQGQAQGQAQGGQGTGQKVVPTKAVSGSVYAAMRESLSSRARTHSQSFSSASKTMDIRDITDVAAAGLGGISKGASRGGGNQPVAAVEGMGMGDTTVQSFGEAFIRTKGGLQVVFGYIYYVCNAFSVSSVSILCVNFMFD